ATSITGEATSDDCAEDIGVTGYCHISAWRVKSCEDIAGRPNVYGLSCAGNGWANTIKLHVTGPTRICIAADAWTCRSTINILVVEIVRFHVYVPGKPN